MRKLTLITLALIFSGSTAAFACGDGWEPIEGSNACQRTSDAVDGGLQGELRNPTFVVDEKQGGDIGRF